MLYAVEHPQEVITLSLFASAVFCSTPTDFIGHCPRGNPIMSIHRKASTYVDWFVSKKLLVLGGSFGHSCQCIERKKFEKKCGAISGKTGGIRRVAPRMRMRSSSLGGKGRNHGYVVRECLLRYLPKSEAVILKCGHGLMLERRRKPRGAYANF
jgi:hypothetical protein